MLIPADKLATHLQRQLLPLYAITGNEPLLVQEAADAIRACARQQGFSERSSHTISGAHADWASVQGAVQTQSLFAERRMVDIHIPSGKPGKDGSAALQHMARAAANTSTLLVIVTLPRLDKATRSGAWWSALEQHGAAVTVDTVERAALPRWIAQRLHAQGQHVPAGEEGERTLRFFADRVEGNLLAAHQEIQKLALLYPAGELSSAHIETAVLNVARYDVFKLSEAVLSGQILRVQRMLDGLQAEGESEVLVHYTLAEDIRALKRARDALDEGKPMPVALREQRIWGVRERLFERVLPRIQPERIARLLHAAHVVDGIIKGIRAEHWPSNGWQALHQLATALCRETMPPPAATRPARHPCPSA